MYPSKSHTERVADGIVHAASVIGFLIAGGFLLIAGWDLPDPQLQLALGVYVVTVLASICISFAYHLLPRHDWRATMRKWDHAAIYTVIAGTFSPLLLMAGTWSAHAILGVIWVLALVGFGFKLVGTNMDSRWSLLSYLGLGWLALLAMPDFWNGLPGFSTAAIGAGGMFYTIGTLFYRNKRLRYRYPIWHMFGTLGGFSFFAAIWTAVASLSG